MWIYLPFGFFSVVQKRGEEDLTVRARVRGDLDNLRQHMPTLSATKEVGFDYPFRATIPHEEFADGMAKIAMEITWDNFKDEVQETQGLARARVYHEVWGVTSWLGTGGMQ